jgi:hypothetical protein
LPFTAWLALLTLLLGGFGMQHIREWRVAQ